MRPVLFQYIAAFALAVAAVLGTPAFAQQPTAQHPAEQPQAQPPQASSTPSAATTVQPISQPSNLSAFAEQLAAAIKESYPPPATIAVLSFRTIRPSDAPFDLWIADQFSGMLAKAAPGYRVIDRPTVVEAEKRNPSGFGEEFDAHRVAKIGKKLKANVIVIGLVPTVGDSPYFTIEAYDLDRKGVQIATVRGHAVVDVREPAAPFPPDSVSPAGVPPAGKDGISNVSCIHCPDPRFPNGLKNPPHNFVGNVLLNVVVGIDGTVTNVSLVRGCGIEGLDKEALKVVRTWTLTPAHKPDGSLTPAFVHVEVSFRMLN